MKTIYGIERTPCDTRMRERLDPVSPESLRPAFKRVFRQLQRGKALDPMVFLDGHYLVALDGTGYFSSNTIHCASCLHKEHRNGSITYYHQMLGAAIIHPDCREVIPLMPEPIVKQDGTGKNDCERNAAKRFITKLRQDHPVGSKNWHCPLHGAFQASPGPSPLWSHDNAHLRDPSPVAGRGLG